MHVEKVAFAAQKLCFLLENVKLFDSILYPLLSLPIRRDPLILAFVLVKVALLYTCGGCSTIKLHEFDIFLLLGKFSFLKVPNTWRKF